MLPELPPTYLAKQPAGGSSLAKQPIESLSQNLLLCSCAYFLAEVTKIVEGLFYLCAGVFLHHFLDLILEAFVERLLRKWLCHPLKDIEEINQRGNVVAEQMGY